MHIECVSYLCNNNNNVEFLCNSNNLEQTKTEPRHELLLGSVKKNLIVAAAMMHTRGKKLYVNIIYHTVGNTALGWHPKPQRERGYFTGVKHVFSICIYQIALFLITFT